jgi:heat shock protein beta
VSRETLQQHRLLKVMSKKLVRKALEMLRKLASGKSDDDEEEGAAAKGDKSAGQEAYIKFWELYGKNIKLGVIEDPANRSKLTKLLRYRSSASPPAGAANASNATAWRSLDDYVADMKPGQKLIYYIAGESVAAVESSPFLEKLKARGLEVLYMTEPIDEYAVQNMPEYDGHRLQSITKEGFHMPGDDKADKAREVAYTEKLKPLTAYLKKVLGTKVEKVTISNRLASTPCVLVTSQYGYSANLERIMKAQAFADPTKAKFLASRKTLEVNPRHPLINSLLSRAAADPEAVDAETRDLVNVLYDAALLNSGFSIDDAKDFSGRIFRILKSGLKLESLDLLPEIEVAAEEEEEEEDDDDDEEEDEGAAGNEHAEL